jgi:hypothetical protein
MLSMFNSICFIQLLRLALFDSVGFVQARQLVLVPTTVSSTSYVCWNAAEACEIIVASWFYSFWPYFEIQ